MVVRDKMIINWADGRIRMVARTVIVTKFTEVGRNVYRTILQALMQCKHLIRKDF